MVLSNKRCGTQDNHAESFTEASQPWSVFIESKTFNNNKNDFVYNNSTATGTVVSKQNNSTPQHRTLLSSFP